MSRLRKRRHPSYGTWSNMKTRCQNPKASNYRWYGGRGISVCARWAGVGGFRNFIEDMGDKPSARHSLDRIDGNGNYEPGNCRWATVLEQCRNTSAIKLSSVKAEAIRSEYAAGGVSQPQLATRYGVDQALIWRIIHGRTWRAAK